MRPASGGAVASSPPLASGAGRASVCAMTFRPFACALIAVLLATPVVDAQTQRRSIERERDQAATGPGPQERAETRGREARARLLDQLFEQLRTAPSAAEARPFEEAIGALLARSDSPTVDLLMGWAREELAQRRPQAALDYLDGVLAMAPETMDAYYMRGTLHYMTRDLGRAMADLERVLQMEPRHFGALIGIGAILRDTGNPRAAFAAFEAALRLHPNSVQARQGADQLRGRVEGRPS